jgi:hypothetical protein
MNETQFRNLPALFPFRELAICNALSTLKLTEPDPIARRAVQAMFRRRKRSAARAMIAWLSAVAEEPSLHWDDLETRNDAAGDAE